MRSRVPPVLSLQDVTKTYVAGHGACRAAVRALDGIDLEVRGGDLVEIVGARGAGKSTLLLCAAGLVVPDRGSIAWSGERVAAADVLSSGHVMYMSGAEPWSAARKCARACLVLLDAPVAEASGRRALEEWLVELAAREVAVLASGRAPRLSCATRRMAMASGRLLRDVPVADDSGASRVAERDQAASCHSIDRASGAP